MFRYFLFVALFFSAASYAEDYYWVVQGVSDPHFSDAASACSHSRTLLTSTVLERLGPPYTIQYSGGSSALCLGAYGTNYPDGGFSYAQIIRRGDSCPPGEPWDPVTLSCKSECSDKVGDSEPFGRSGPRGDGWYSTVQSGGKTYGVTPNQACLNGCAAKLNQNCVYTISADRYICTGTAYFTGDTCQAGEPAVDSDPLQRDVEPETNKDDEPCVYVQDAEGRLHCVSKSTLEEDGQNCGMAGPAGAEVRVCRPKEANREEKKTETEIEEKPTPDGGTETVKKDVHTETKCTGTPQNCTTTTTTTTTTTNKDGSGTTTKTTVTCKGDKCGQSGTGGSGGGGGGSGDGDDEYDAPGDLVGNDDVPGFGESLGNFSSRIQGSPVVSAVQSISFPSGGSCNMPSANVYLIGTVSFDWFCQNADILDALYYVMLGVFALGAVRLFLEA